MTTICPPPTCADPEACAERRSCILPPLMALSDWRADPYPYPLRRDDKPRAVFNVGAQP